MSKNMLIKLKPLKIPFKKMSKKVQNEEQPKIWKNIPKNKVKHGPRKHEKIFHIFFFFGLFFKVVFWSLNFWHISKKNFECIIEVLFFGLFFELFWWSFFVNFLSSICRAIEQRTNRVRWFIGSLLVILVFLR